MQRWRGDRQGPNNGRAPSDAEPPTADRIDTDASRYGPPPRTLTSPRHPRFQTARRDTRPRREAIRRTPQCRWNRGGLRSCHPGCTTWCAKAPPQLPAGSLPSLGRKIESYGENFQPERTPPAVEGGGRWSSLSEVPDRSPTEAKERPALKVSPGRQSVHQVSIERRASAGAIQHDQRGVAGGVARFLPRADSLFRRAPTLAADQCRSSQRQACADPRRLGGASRPHAAGRRRPSQRYRRRRQTKRWSASGSKQLAPREGRRRPQCARKSGRLRMPKSTPGRGNSRQPPKAPVADLPVMPERALISAGPQVPQRRQRPVHLVGFRRRPASS